MGVIMHQSRSQLKSCGDYASRSAQQAGYNRKMQIGRFKVRPVQVFVIVLALVLAGPCFWIIWYQIFKVALLLGAIILVQSLVFLPFWLSRRQAKRQSGDVVSENTPAD
jgi:hypothetical protein